MIDVALLLMLLWATSGLALAITAEQLTHYSWPSFQVWAKNHDKVYANHSEEQRRFLIWTSNHERIEAHNQQLPRPTFTLGHNQFSDWTEDELDRLFPPRRTISKFNDHNNVKVHWKRRLFETIATPSTIPDYVNWTELGAVTPVKNQGICGACWAFSTTGALEGAKFVKTGELVSLSEQNLIDCDHADFGCQGGFMDTAFVFDEKRGGLCSEADYPYVAWQRPFCLNCTDIPGTFVRSIVDVPPGNQTALLAALAIQPVAIGIQANQFEFLFYRHGVITSDDCGKDGMANHAVLAVGYGTDTDTQQPYFLVKNSWGRWWGDHGYVKVGRNSTNPNGICAILTFPSFPVVG